MTQKRVNKGLVLGLSVFGFVTIIGVSALMLRQLRQKDPKHFVELAKRAEEEGHWQRAAIFYNEAWDRSGDAAYLVPVGENLLREGELVQCRSAWRQALVRQPSLIEAHVKQLELLLQLARLYGGLKDWEDVRDAAEAMLRVESGKTPQQDALAHHAAGLAYVNLEVRDGRNVDKGIALLETAAKLDAAKVEYRIDLAAQFVRRNRIAEGEDIFRALIDEHDEAGSAAAKVRAGYAKYLATGQRFDEADARFKESVALAGGDAEALRDAKLAYAAFLTGRWARQLRDPAGSDKAAAFFEQAKLVLREVIEVEPQGFDAYLQLGTLLKASNKFEDVVEVCEQRLRLGLSRKGVEAVRNRISTFNLMIFASEASTALGIMSSQAGDSEARDRWLAKAEQYVTDAKGEFQAHPRVLSQAGRVKIAKGMDRQALEDLRAADEAYKAVETLSWENRMIRARVHMKLSEPGAARQVLEEVINDATKLRAADPLFWNLYAQVLFQLNDHDRALAMSDRVLLFDPQNAEAKQLKAAVYERQGKHEEAGKLIEELTGTTSVRSMLQARAMLLDGNVDGALAVIREALKTDPADANLISFAVNELLNADRADEAQAVAAKALELKPDDGTLQRLAVLARRDLSTEQRDEAMLKLIEAEADGFRRSLDLVLFYARKNDAARTLAHIDQAERHLIAKDTPLARTSTSAQHGALLRTKLRVAAQIGDSAALDAVREAAAKHNVDGAGGKSILGLYHMQRRELDLAINTFREAVHQQPTDASSLVYLGQCLFTLDRTEEALNAYEEAARVNPNQGYAHQGLALLAQRRGDREGFERELKTCERLIPSDAWVQEQLVAKAEEGDPAAAIRKREAQLAGEPNDPRNLRRLAALCEQVRDLPKADGYVARLAAIAPEEEKTVGAASAYYRRTHRPEKSLELMRRYAESRATPAAKAEALLQVAIDQRFMRDTDGALQTLLAAIDLAPTITTLHAVAEFHLRVVGKADKALTWFDRAVDEGRRSNSPRLPVLLEGRIETLLQRSVNHLDQARRDVADLRQQFPDYARGLLWESELHARTGAIEGAIASLGEYVRRKPRDAYALFQRARYHVVQGQIAAAIQDLNAAKRADPLAMELEPRLLLARLHLDTGRRDLWVAELESLVKEAPGVGRAVEELVAAYVTEKRFNDADRTVTAEINRRGTSAEASWFVLRGAVALSMGASDRASADFLRAAEMSKNAPGVIAAELAGYVRAGKPGEGAEFYERLELKEPLGWATAATYAHLLGKAGRGEQAVDQFRVAMALASRDGNDAVRAVTGEILAAFGAEKAVALFEGQSPVVGVDRANGRILVRLYASAGRFADAHKRADALLSSVPDEVERGRLLHEKGDVYQLAGDARAAIAAYEEALKYDPANWVAINNIAFLLSDKLGEHKKALPHAKKAVELADNPNTLDTLGWCYVGLGQYSDAVAELGRAIRLQPGDPLLYYHLGEAYRRAGQFSPAGDVLAIAANLVQSVGGSELADPISSAREKASRRDDTP